MSETVEIALLASMVVAVAGIWMWVLVSIYRDTEKRGKKK